MRQDNDLSMNLETDNMTCGKLRAFNSQSIAQQHLRDFDFSLTTRHTLQVLGTYLSLPYLLGEHT